MTTFHGDLDTARKKATKKRATVSGCGGLCSIFHQQQKKKKNTHESSEEPSPAAKEKEKAEESLPRLRREHQFSSFSFSRRRTRTPAAAAAMFAVSGKNSPDFRFITMSSSHIFPLLLTTFLLLLTDHQFVRQGYALKATLSYVPLVSFAFYFLAKKIFLFY